MKKKYLLDYPNYEVRTTMEQYFLSVFMQMDYAQARNFALEFDITYASKEVYLSH